MKSFIAFPMVVLFMTISCSFGTNDSGAIVYSVTLKPVVSGLEAPIGMAAPDDGSGRLFVIEQQGMVRIIKSGQLISQPFLDVSGKWKILCLLFSTNSNKWHGSQKCDRRIYCFS